jgi:ankyrin repeat protein
MYDASNGRIEIVNTLISVGADNFAKTKNGNTALDFAKKYKHDEISKLLEM